MKKTVIFQMSMVHTASTVLVNALYGLIPELNDKKIIGVWEWDNNSQKYFNDIIVIKCHGSSISINNFMAQHDPNKYDVYFICSERKAQNILFDNRFRSEKNVVFFDYDELNETEQNTIPKIVENIYNKINKMLKIELSIEGGINRIIAMNKRYEEIKDKPFDYIDDFFEIHGHHRNRS